MKVEAIDPEQWLAENNGGSRRGDRRNGAASEPLASPARQVAPASNTVADEAPAQGATAASPAQDHPADSSPLYLQVAALGSDENAQALRARLQAELSHPVRVEASAGVHRVQVGPLANAGQVDPVRDELRRAGFDQAYVVNGAD